MSVGALDLHIQTEAGSSWPPFPFSSTLHVDMVLRADYFLSGEVQLTIGGGRVKLHCLTPSIFFGSNFPSWKTAVTDV